MDGLWATKSEGVGLIIVHAISFQDFHICDPDPPTSQTVRQTTYTIAIPRFALGLQCIARQNKKA